MSIGIGDHLLGERLVTALGFERDEYFLAWVSSGTLYIRCKDSEMAFAINDRQREFSNKLLAVPQSFLVQRIHVDFSLDGEPRIFEFNLITGDDQMLLLAGGINPRMLSALLMDAESDRLLLARMLENGAAGHCEYLTDFELDTIRLGTRDIAAAEDAIYIKPGLVIENDTKPYWNLQKLIEYKRDLRQALTPDDPSSAITVTWEAKGTGADGEMSRYELRNTGEARLVTFRGRVHRLVRVLESVPLIHA